MLKLKHDDGCKECLCYTCRYDLAKDECCMTNKKAKPQVGCPITSCGDYKKDGEKEEV